jgi:hypothetical protein
MRHQARCSSSNSSEVQSRKFFVPIWPGTLPILRYCGVCQTLQTVPGSSTSFPVLHAVLSSLRLVAGPPHHASGSPTATWPSKRSLVTAATNQSCRTNSKVSCVPRQCTPHICSYLRWTPPCANPAEVTRRVTQSVADLYAAVLRAFSPTEIFRNVMCAILRPLIRCVI